MSRLDWITAESPQPHPDDVERARAGFKDDPQARRLITSVAANARHDWDLDPSEDPFVLAESAAATMLAMIYTGDILLKATTKERDLYRQRCIEGIALTAFPQVFVPEPAPEPQDAVRKASKEAIVLIDEINARAPSRMFYGISQTLHAKLCTVRATLARALAKDAVELAPEPPRSILTAQTQGLGKGADSCMIRQAERIAFLEEQMQRIADVTERWTHSLASQVNEIAHGALNGKAGSPSPERRQGCE